MIAVKTPPYLLSFSGFDPSAGAGTHADIKTFNSLNCHGLSSLTAITNQTEDSYFGTEWIKLSQIKEQTKPLLEKYNPKFCKIALTGSTELVKGLIDWLREKTPDIFILFDPILESSSSEVFYSKSDFSELLDIIKMVDIVTPNSKEAMLISEQDSIDKAGEILGKNTYALLTGISVKESKDKVQDALTYQNKKTIIKRAFTENKKHGSGCVFSSSLLSFLALSHCSSITFEEISNAANKAGNYTFEFLNSSSSLLGFHHSTKTV